jgi:catechol 2,3-dioxygenase-like lactoylglutathione lyase family enzyme
MSTEIPSIVSHVSLGSNRFEEAVVFYEKVLATVGAKRLMAHPGAVAFGKLYPEFWIHAPADGRPATVGNGVHFGFVAQSQEQVRAFHAAALAAGAADDGAPGPRADYGEPYYGCFVRDLDGHKIEAAFWNFELAQKLGLG